MNFCKYHPVIAARWYCAHCALYSCGRCVAQDGQSALTRCFLCNQPLQPAAARAAPAAPRSTVWPVAFLRNTAAAVLVAGCVLLWVLFRLQPQLGLLPQLFPLLVCLGYGSLLLAHMAHGNNTLPPVSALCQTSDKVVVVRLMVLLSIAALIPGWVAKYGGAPLALLVLQLGLVILPALLVVTITEPRALHLFNPLRWCQQGRGLGKYYFVLLLALELWFLSWGLFGYFAARGPLLVAGGILALQLYAGVALAYGTGSLIFLRRQELAFTARPLAALLHEDDPALPRWAPWVNLCDKARVLIREGRMLEGKRAVVQAVHAYPTNLQVQQYCHDILRHAGTVEERLRMGWAYVNVLRDLQQEDLAGRVSQEMAALQKSLPGGKARPAALLH